MLENLKEKCGHFVTNTAFFAQLQLFVKNTIYNLLRCNTTRLVPHCVEFLSRISLVSFVEVLRNNILGFIEERRGGIRAYHCRSGGFAYRGFPLLVRIRRLTVQPAP